MKSPNSIYADTTIYGGIPVKSADIIKVFCDIDKIIKVRRSIIKFEYNNLPYYYTVENPDVVLKVNGTAVRVRATTLDLSKIYVFDCEHDMFLGVVNETLGVFGDSESLREHPDDKYAIMRHGKRIKGIKQEFESRHRETQEDFDYPENFELSFEESELETL
jgi:hypothetical protein